jgi:hypothetical protein
MVLRALPEANLINTRLQPGVRQRSITELVSPALVIPPAGADVCFAGHANNVGGALVPRPGFILHQATKAKGLSVSLFGALLATHSAGFRPVLLRRGFVRCSR